MKKKEEAKSPENYVGGIAEFAKLSVSVQSDLLAYYLLVLSDRASIGAADIDGLRVLLQLPPHRSIQTYLSNSTRNGKGWSPKYVRAKTGYVLERAYQATLATKYLGRQAAKAVAQDLRAELKRVSNPDESAYLSEAVSCFEYGLFRAAIVLTWCVAYSRFRDWLFTKHLGAFNALSSAWAKPITIKSIEDFQELNEATVIDTAKKSSAISKELNKTLKHLLDQRNSYAHPSSKPIRSSIAEAYIETALQEIVTKLK
jgi:hypothetical protein